MNTNPHNILPASVRDCNILSTIQMYFKFIDRRHSENDCSQLSIESAENYLADLQYYAEMCTKYYHLRGSVDIAYRYLSVATLMLKQMKGEI